jgi:hypothetical protein
MARNGAPVRFRETEVARAIRAADRAGQQISTITIDRDGQVTLQVEKRPADENEERPSAA